MCADLLNWRLIATVASRLRLQRPASLRGEDALVWLDSLHTDHEQVYEHRDLRDCWQDDADEGVMGPGKIGSDLLAEVWDQEQRQHVHEVAHARHNEQDAQPLGEHP